MYYTQLYFVRIIIKLSIPVRSVRKGGKVAVKGKLTNSARSGIVVVITRERISSNYAKRDIEMMSRFPKKGIVQRTLFTLLFAYNAFSTFFEKLHIHLYYLCAFLLKTSL